MNRRAEITKGVKRCAEMVCNTPNITQGYIDGLLDLCKCYTTIEILTAMKECIADDSGFFPSCGQVYQMCKEQEHRQIVLNGVGYLKVLEQKRSALGLPKKTAGLLEG